MVEAGLPSNFLWGFATAAYQIEGAIHQDSRGPSIWDTFCDIPGKIADGSSGAVACDSYNRTAEDIALLRATGAKAYRFSIAWSRIIPVGGRDDSVNQAGVDHYVKFVDDLLVAGIVPLVTLFHWDLPEGLEQRYGGLLNKDEFVQDFVHYADVMFEALGSRVNYWTTFNEPYCSAINGYGIGVFAPGRTSDRETSSTGDSSTEPWIVGHSLLVAHGAAVKSYRDKFQERDGGVIGIVLNGNWAEPWDAGSKEDHEAVQRHNEFAVGWFGDPIYVGDYPASMRTQLGSRLPQFTDAERALVHGSNDYFGFNHYCTAYVRHKPDPPSENDFSGNFDIVYENSEGTSIGPETQSFWLRPYPAGFRKLLKWISDRYNRPVIYVTENGTSIKGENDLGTREQVQQDDFRVQYFKDYIEAMAQAVAQDGVDCRGYMAWSLMDNFEWADGYETRFGCTYVDYEDNQKRYPKKSALELKQIFEQYIGKV